MLHRQARRSLRLALRHSSSTPSISWPSVNTSAWTMRGSPKTRFAANVRNRHSEHDIVDDDARRRGELFWRRLRLRISMRALRCACRTRISPAASAECVAFRCDGCAGHETAPAAGRQWIESNWQRLLELEIGINQHHDRRGRVASARAVGADKSADGLSRIGQLPHFSS